MMEGYNVGKYIVAITACPTGIAHTYMAAEKLALVGKEMGYEVKVETQGTSGAQNILSEEDIARADGIILAVDKEIDESRFAGKQVLKTSVGKAIREPRELIENAVNKTNTVKINAKKGEEQNTLSSKGVKSIYKHIMAGVSYMLPIVVAGGILTALSFAFGIYAFQEEGSLAWAFFQIGASGALGLMVPVLSAYIAHSIADKAGFAAGLVGGWLANSVGAGFLGGMLAGFIAGYVTLFLNKSIRLPVTFRGIKDILILPILSVAIVGILMLYVIGTPIKALNSSITDLLTALSGGSIIIMGIIFGILYWDLGGPFSKVLYAFAVGMIAEGVYEPMAAVIVCGMIPPLGMAVATFIRPQLWTQQQKEAGKASLFLGLSYITEGAIPFAAESPLVVIPSCVIGGAVGAIVSMAMNTGIVAPHGGIFLLLIPNAVHNPVGFLVALVIGTIVTALTVTVLKTYDMKRK
jgi:PTS system fructose-specific IIC component